ncbi:MAG: DinB family protein [Sphingobacteriales bacterium]|nr:DinB family protein [Sphingobacteriales bacterium]
MLRRTTGRLLLLLLVVTGSAGTIKDNSLSKSERKYAITIMKDSHKDVVKATKGLSGAQLDFRTSPDRWSVKECVYHIAAAEKLLWSMFEGAMKNPPNPEKRAEIKVQDDALVQMVQDRSKKNQAPEPLQPKNTGYRDLADALADFKATRTEHIKYIRNSTEDMRDRVVQMPFGWIDCYQLYIFIAAHSKRHTLQLTEVKAAAGFPKE